MSGRPYVPAVLVWHDALGAAAVRRVTRVLDGAGRAVVGCPATRFTADVAAPALDGVGAYDAFLVVHVVGPFVDPGLQVADRGPDPAGAVLAELAQVAEAFRARWPGKARVDQWVVQAVGQSFDSAERAVIRAVLADADPSLRGVVLSASATQASVTHDDVQQAGFAADVVLALLGSDLETHLADVRSTVWFVGATSVTYSRSRVREVVSAHYARRLLDTGLLAPLPAGDPAYEVGVAWVQDQEFAGEGERDLLLAAPGGGGLRSALRLRVIDWATIPLTSWSAVLTTFRSMVALERLPDVERALEANRRRRVDDLRAAVIGEAFRQAERRGSLAAVLEFLRGARAALTEAAAAVSAAGSPVDAEAVDRDVERLQHLTRWHPFGPAVALRVFALALGVLVIVGALTGPSGYAALDWATEPWARLAGVAVLLLGFLAHQRRIAVVLRVRDRLRAEIEDEAVARLEHLVAEARRGTLLEVRAWIGGRPHWLDDGEPPARPVGAPTLVEWFSWCATETRRAAASLGEGAEGAGGESVASPYTVDLPSPPWLPAESLAAGLLHDEPRAWDAARSFALRVRPLCVPDAMIVPAADDLAEFWLGWLSTLLGEGVWENLGDLFTDRPRLRDGARAVLERDTTPAIPTRTGRPDIGTRHYLVVPGGEAGAVHRLLFAPDVDASALPRRLVSASLTAVLPGVLPDVALMVHLYGVRPADLEPHGGATETERPDGSGAIG